MLVPMLVLVLVAVELAAKRHRSGTRDSFDLAEIKQQRAYGLSKTLGGGGHPGSFISTSDSLKQEYGVAQGDPGQARVMI